jgi:hypothetical protein
MYRARAYSVATKLLFLHKFAKCHFSNDRFPRSSENDKLRVFRLENLVLRKKDKLFAATLTVPYNYNGNTYKCQVLS